MARKRTSTIGQTLDQTSLDNLMALRKRVPRENTRQRKRRLDGQGERARERLFKKAARQRELDKQSQTR